MKAANADPEAFPRLKEVERNLEPGGVFRGVTLLPGWLQVMAEEIQEKTALAGPRDNNMKSKKTIEDLPKILRIRWKNELPLFYTAK
jgi:hypothetical protein